MLFAKWIRTSPDNFWLSFSPGYFPVGTIGLFLAAFFALSAKAQSQESAPDKQPFLGVRSVKLLQQDGLRFKDLNQNGQLDPYEDWRLLAQQRS